MITHLNCFNYVYIYNADTLTITFCRTVTEFVYKLGVIEDRKVTKDLQVLYTNSHFTDFCPNIMGEVTMTGYCVLWVRLP